MWTVVAILVFAGLAALYDPVLGLGILATALTSWVSSVLAHVLVAVVNLIVVGFFAKLFVRGHRATTTQLLAWLDTRLFVRYPAANTARVRALALWNSTPFTLVRQNIVTYTRTLLENVGVVPLFRLAMSRYYTATLLARQVTVTDPPADTQTAKKDE